MEYPQKNASFFIEIVNRIYVSLLFLSCTTPKFVEISQRAPVWASVAYNIMSITDADVNL